MIQLLRRIRSIVIALPLCVIGTANASEPADPGSLKIPAIKAAPVLPAMSRVEIDAGLKSHDRALYIKEGWIRDPYITLGPDDCYYNLYYCTSDKVDGTYGPRHFAGRFLGHGTPFQTRDGKWWCTAFFNANVPPLPREGIETRDLSENAQTINQRGTTIVPLEVRLLEDGTVFIRAKDPAYATPGRDEVQKFK